jgi:hypothetical protein
MGRNFTFAYDVSMHIHLTFQPVASIVTGLVVLFKPELLNYVVAIYLLFIGLVGLFA